MLQLVSWTPIVCAAVIACNANADIWNDTSRILIAEASLTGQSNQDAAILLHNRGLWDENAAVSLNYGVGSIDMQSTQNSFIADDWFTISTSLSVHYDAGWPSNIATVAAASGFWVSFTLDEETTIQIDFNATQMLVGENDEDLLTIRDQDLNDLFLFSSFTQGPDLHTTITLDAGTYEFSYSAAFYGPNAMSDHAFAANLSFALIPAPSALGLFAAASLIATRRRR